MVWGETPSTSGHPPRPEARSQAPSAVTVEGYRVLCGVCLGIEFRGRVELLSCSSAQMREDKRIGCGRPQTRWWRDGHYIRCL